MNTVTLIGTEDMIRSGRMHQQAADDSGRAASNFNGAMDRFERLVERFEAAVTQLADAPQRIEISVKP